MIKGFIFDLDGVISSTSQLHWNAWKETGKLLKIVLPDSYEEQLRGVPRKKCLDKIICDFNLNIDKVGYTIDSLLKIKNEIYIKQLENLNRESILDNIEDILSFLKENKFKIALASISTNAKFIIDKLELNTYFDYILDIKKVKNLKPDPEMFLTTIKGMELKNNEIIIIDDSEIGMETCKIGNLISIGIGVLGNYYYESTRKLTIKEIERILQKENEKD